MKKHERSTEEYIRPQKFILYMARKGQEWAGRVLSFDRSEEYRFTSLEDLKNWLNKDEGEEETK